MLAVLTFLILLPIGAYFGAKLIRQNPRNTIDLTQQGSNNVNSSKSSYEVLRNKLLQEDKIQRCLESQQGIRDKLEQTLPKYKVYLTKVKNDEKLTKEDDFNLTLYKFLEIWLENNKSFNVLSEATPSSYDTDTLKSAGDWVLRPNMYCPNVSKVSLEYPRTVDTCIEMETSQLYSQTKAIIPLNRNSYKYQEEYEADLKRQENSVNASLRDIKDRCNGNIKY